MDYITKHMQTKTFTNTVQDIGKLVETVALQGQMLKDQQDCLREMAQRIE